MPKFTVTVRHAPVAVAPDPKDWTTPVRLSSASELTVHAPDFVAAAQTALESIKEQFPTERVTSVFMFGYGDAQ